MNPIFYEIYKNYPTLDLLKIAGQPATYQPEAIAAVNQILQEREVTDQDRALAAQFLHDKEAAEEVEKGRPVTPVLETVPPTDHVLFHNIPHPPIKWWNLFLVLLVAQNAAVLAMGIRDIVRFIGFVNECEQDGFNASDTPLSLSGCFASLISVSVALEIIGLVYIPVSLYLLFKKRRWGWMLVFADNLAWFLIILGGGMALFFMYHEFQGGILVYAGHLVVKGVFAGFLWRDAIAGYYGVAHKAKNRTAVLATVFSIVCIVAMLMIGW